MGKLVAIIGVCYVGNLEVGQRVVEPLRRLGTPIADIAGPMPYPAIFALTDEAGHGNVHGPLGLPGRARGRHPGGHRGARSAHAGAVRPGAAARAGRRNGARPVEATAFAHRDKPYMATVIGSTSDPVDIERQRAWTEELWGILRPRSQGVYMNFLEDEGAGRVREAYAPATYARLVAIKRRYDPANLFRFNQNIRPTD